jgi:protein-S-isoprenylcysteine O-methyltransferase Ste14
MVQDTHRTSRNYAVAQTLLLFAFAGAFFMDTGPRLFTAGTPGTVGAVLCSVGLLLMLLAFVSIGGSIQIAPEPRVGGQLVTRGVYRRLRHPIYTAIVVLVVGLFLRKPTVPMAIVGAFVIVFLVVKARFEETLLLARYPEYAEYRRRTLGIVPWLGRSPSTTVDR